MHSLYTPREVANELKVDLVEVYRLIEERKLSILKIESMTIVIGRSIESYKVKLGST